MVPVSEASKPSSEQSDASSVGSKDSSQTKLDPHLCAVSLMKVGVLTCEGPDIPSEH